MTSANTPNFTKFSMLNSGQNSGQDSKKINADSSQSEPNWRPLNLASSNQPVPNRQAEDKIVKSFTPLNLNHFLKQSGPNIPNLSQRALDHSQLHAMTKSAGRLNLEGNPKAGTESKADGDSSEAKSEQDNLAEAKFSNQDMQEAMDLSYQQGFEAGLAQGTEQRESNQRAIETEIMTRFTDSLSTWSRHQKENFEIIAMTSAEICLAAINKFMTAYLEVNGDQEILKSCRESFAKLQDAHWLQVKVNPQQIALLEPNLHKLLQEFRLDKNFALIGDESLEAGDVILDWDSGGMNIIHHQLRADLQSALDLVIDNIERERKGMVKSQQKRRSTARSSTKPALSNGNDNSTLNASADSKLDEVIPKPRRRTVKTPKTSEPTL